MRNFAIHLWRTLAGHDDAVALRTPGDPGDPVQELTFKAWSRQIHRLAVGLMEKGLKPGDCVGMVAQNCTDWITFAAAVWVAGGCVVPLVPGRERRETLRCLARSGCDWIVVRDRDGLDHIRGQAANLPEHLQWVLLDATGAPSAPNVHTLTAIGEAGHYRERRGGEKELAKRMFEQPLEQPVLVLFAPEPGDDPHGAFFTGPQAMGLLQGLSEDLLLEPGDRLAVILSQGWLHAFLMTFATLMAGASVASAPSLGTLIKQLHALSPTHLLTGPAFLQAQATRWQQRLEKAPEFLKKMTQEPAEASIFSLSRTLGALGAGAAERVLGEPIRKDLGDSLRAIFVVEGHLSDEVHQVLGRMDISLLGLHGYPECGITHMERAGAARRNSVGRPLQGVACKIQGAKTSEPGEILIKSSSLFQGYWDEQGPRQLVQGWLHTGERGHIEEGFLFLEREASAHEEDQAQEEE